MCRIQGHLLIKIYTRTTRNFNKHYKKHKLRNFFTNKRTHNWNKMRPLHMRTSLWNYFEDILTVYFLWIHALHPNKCIGISHYRFIRLPSWEAVEKQPFRIPKFFGRTVNLPNTIFFCFWIHDLYEPISE